MMGHTHVLSGAVVWLAAAPSLSSTGWLGTEAWLGGPHTSSLSVAQLAAGAVIASGAALLPDIDHPDGTIAHTLGPVSHTMCRWVEKISGGHRHATHSLLFMAAMGAGMGALALHAVWLWWVLTFVLVGWGMRGLGVDFERHEPWSSILDIAVAGGATFLMHSLDMQFVAYAVAIGCLAHLAGDCLTPRGCPLLWPIPWRFEIPVIPRTNGRVERRFVAPGLAVVAVGLGVWTLAYGIVARAVT